MTMRNPVISSLAKRGILFIVTVWCLVSSSMSQGIAPVDITVQLVPPYTSRIVDYVAPGNEKLRIIALQRDLTQASYRFFLRMEVSVNGQVLFRTSRNWQPPATIIAPGTPVILDGTDLQPYFDANHLDFVNFSRDQYIVNPNLPEGYTSVCFTAYDYGRPDVAVSQTNCGNYFLTLPEPPLLNYPACGMQVRALLPQQVIFSWVPMNMGNTASQSTVYELSLYENRDHRNANDIVQNIAPIYTNRTQASTLVYGPGEPALQTGMNYVWRVQAVDENGRQAFRNNGFSQPCDFTYSTDSTFNWSNAQPLQVFAQAMNETNAKISWRPDKDIAYDKYTVYYRKKGDDNNWFNNTLTDTVFFLSGLEPNTPYETRVQGIKGASSGLYSNMAAFTTPQKKVVDCKQAAGILAAYNGRPYLKAMHGDIVHYGSFDLTLDRVQQEQSGYYSGTGTVIIPFMANMILSVSFSNIQIDDDMQVTAGEVIFDSEGVDAWAANTPGLDTVVRGIIKSIGDLFKTGDKEGLQGVTNELLGTGITSTGWESTLPDLQTAVTNAVQDPVASAAVSALNTMEASKLAYDSAQKQLANATTDAEKQAAQQKMDNASASYAAARQQLSSSLQQAADMIKYRFPTPEWFTAVDSFLIKYKGITADKSLARYYWHLQTDSAYDLVKNTYNLPDSLQQRLDNAFQAATPAWNGLEQGIAFMPGRNGNSGGYASFNNWQHAFADNLPQAKDLVATLEKAVEYHMAANMKIVQDDNLEEGEYLRSLPVPCSNKFLTKTGAIVTIDFTRYYNFKLNKDGYLQSFSSANGTTYEAGYAITTEKDAKTSVEKETGVSGVYFLDFRGYTRDGHKGVGKVVKDGVEAVYYSSPDILNYKADIAYEACGTGKTVVQAVDAKGNIAACKVVTSCSNNGGKAPGSGGGSYIEQLAGRKGSAGNKSQGQPQQGQTQVLDYTGRLTAQEVQKMLEDLAKTQGYTGVTGKVFLTDDATDPKKVDAVKTYMADIKGKETAIWVNFTADGKYDVKIGVGDGIKGHNDASTNTFLKKLAEFLPRLDGLYCNPFTAILDGIAGLIGQLEISARYYNPDEKDYNPLPSQVYGWITGQALVDVAKDAILGSNPYTDKYSDTRCSFAMVCGAWNGLVGLVGGIPSGASMVIKCITNEDHVRDSLFSKIGKLSWSGIKKMAAEKFQKATSNPCMVSYTSGEVVFFVASCFIGAGEFGAVSDALQILNKLDVVGHIMSPVMKLAGWAIKPVLIGAGKAGKFVFKVGKAFIGEGLTLERGKAYSCLIPIPPINLSPNIKAAFEKAKELLQNSKADFEKAVTLTKDDAGNLIKDADGNIRGEIEVTLPDGSKEKVEVLLNEEEAKLKQAAEETEGGTNAVKKGQDLLAKIDELGLTNLKKEISLLDEATQNKFFDDFAGAHMETLKALDKKTDLLGHWKDYGGVIKNNRYPGVGHKPWDATKNAIIAKGDAVENKILDAIENAEAPSNSQVALAGAYSPELGGNVALKYNVKNFDINQLEPELKQHLDYLTMIKKDYDAGGSLYEKLYSNVPLQKIENAGNPGFHAEVLAVNEVVKALKAAGKFNSIQDLGKIHVLVKGVPRFGNMCRCPHCFQIISGVNMIGNQ